MKKYIARGRFFSVTSVNGWFLRQKDPTHQNTLKFIEKTLFSAIKKWECVNKYPKTFRKLTDGGIRTHCFWLPNHDNTPHICIIRATNNYAQLHTKSARHRQFQEKKKLQLLNWIFFFRKIFSNENDNKVRKSRALFLPEFED